MCNKAELTPCCALLHELMELNMLSSENGKAMLYCAYCLGTPPKPWSGE
jgi:hypothetical protein